MNAFNQIYERYVDEASFLWILRSVAVDQPHNNATDIFELEQRIEAQLDGLMTSLDESWEICLQALELAEPGEVFTSAVIAFRSHDMAKIQKVVEVGLSNDDAVKGLISAIGWLPDKLGKLWINRFITSKDLDHKYLAVAGCSVRRENPGEYLNRIFERDDCRQHKRLYPRALRLIGELRRQDLMPELEKAMAADDEEIKIQANWSAVLLGNRGAVLNLEPYIFQAGPHQMNALNLAFRVLPIERAKSWISRLAKDKEQVRAVIKASGILGDPHAINWLIKKMENAETARLAAEAFTLITGIDLVEQELTMEAPSDLSEQPNDDSEDGDISMDEDENLPWPEVEKITRIWINQGKAFIAGQRYFFGQKITPVLLTEKLGSANQRQRHAAAMELALTDSEKPLQNTRARVR